MSPDERDSESLSLFQSFMCNNDEECSRLSNVVMLWEKIPKFSGEHLNKQSDLALDYENKFYINKTPFKMTLLPGTFYKKCPKTKKMLLSVYFRPRTAIDRPEAIKVTPAPRLSTFERRGRVRM